MVMGVERTHGPKAKFEAGMGLSMGLSIGLGMGMWMDMGLVMNMAIA